MTDIGQTHRLAVLVGNDQWIEIRGVTEPAIRFNREIARLALQGSGRQIGVGGLDRIDHLVDAESTRRQGVGIDKQAHRIFLRSRDLHLCHAADGRKPLRDMGVGKLVDVRHRHIFR